MCGRFTLLLPWSEIHQMLDGFVTHMKSDAIAQISAAPTRYNIAPTQPILVLTRAGKFTKPFLMRWGLVPEWVDNPADFPLIINARAETLAQKTSFKNSLKNQRCLIPASGYYEWKRHLDGTKTPQYITRKDSLPIFMAGLHSTWTGPDGEEVDTAAIITVGAGDQLKEVHHRTPVMLEGRDIDLWLDSASVNAQTAQKLLRPIVEGAMKFHAVSTQVNSPKNDSDDLIVPFFVQEQNNARKNEPTKKNKTTKNPVAAKPSQLDLF